MNKITWFIGALIILVLIGIVFFFNSGGIVGTGATTTVATTGTTTGTIGSAETATPGAPIAATNASVAPTDTTAVVTGTVNPDGAPTSYWYEFGTTPSLGQKTSTQMVGSGFTAIKTPGYITGLTKGTTYYFRLVAQNAYGKSTGDQESVTTTVGTPAPVGAAPVAKTLAVSGQTSTGAVLSGSVNPNRSSTEYWFEYGTSANLGSITAFILAGNGATAVSASAPLSGLAPGTTYYYRLNAQNQFGTSNGSVLTFKTAGGTPVTAGAPVVTTQVVSAIATTSATFNGTVNPSGESTKYWFEYGTDSLLGSVLVKTTPQKAVGAGRTTVSAQASVSNLSANTTYYVRLVAQNASGTVRGDTQTFKTN